MQSVLVIMAGLHCSNYTVPKMDGKVRVIRHSDHDSSANKPDFSLKNIARNYTEFSGDTLIFP
jgi:hypothetical protein